MGFRNFIAHTIGTGVVVGVVAGPLEKMIRNSSITEGEKKRWVGAAVGAATGAPVGYYVGERIADHGGPYSIKDKAMSSAIGALGGGVLGYVTGMYLDKPQP